MVAGDKPAGKDGRLLETELRRSLASPSKERSPPWPGTGSSAPPGPCVLGRCGLSRAHSRGGRTPRLLPEPPLPGPSLTLWQSLWGRKQLSKHPNPGVSWNTSPARTGWIGGLTSALFREPQAQREPLRRPQVTVQSSFGAAFARIGLPPVFHPSPFPVSRFSTFAHALSATSRKAPEPPPVAPKDPLWRLRAALSAGLCSSGGGDRGHVQNRCCRAPILVAPRCPWNSEEGWPGSPAPAQTPSELRGSGSAPAQGAAGVRSRVSESGGTWAPLGSVSCLWPR